MVYETSYDSGRKPFSPDLSRGYWEQPNDFLWLCLAMAFKMDFFGMSWFYVGHTGIYIVFSYVLSLFMFGVPLMVVHMFLGQFSGTGFISSLRIAPFFKGIGFVSLGINLCILTYYGVFATVPLLYFFNSFRPTLPWSCEVAEQWNTTIACNPQVLGNSTDSMNATEVLWDIYHIPSVLYFSRTYFEEMAYYRSEETDFEFSWELFGCNIVVWSIIAGIFYKFLQTEKFGQLMRYLIGTALGILVFCVFRFSFLPGSGKVLSRFFTFRKAEMFYSIPVSIVAIISSFGGGWGIIVSLASHNKFKTNILAYSWLTSLGQMVINLLLATISIIIEEHYIHLSDMAIMHPVEAHWGLILSSGSAIANLHWPNLWSLLYFGFLALLAIIVMCIQLQTIVTSVCDEFEGLRKYKSELALGLIGTLAVISTYYCSNHGLTNFFALSLDGLFTSSTIMLLILLVVLWIYGRERFQRDIEFMLSQKFATWKVNTLRFVAPLNLSLCLFFAGVLGYYEHYAGTAVVIGAAIAFIVLPWLAIPFYGVLGMLHTSGSCWVRFKRCCRPTDWYPVEQEDRQRYEESMGNMDITHQLNEVLEDVL